MTDRTELASGGYKALLGATLKAMHIAESNGRMDEAGLHAAQAAALIGKLRSLRLENQRFPDAMDLHAR